MLGAPSPKDFKHIAQTNQIANDPVTLEDIKIAESVFGKDIGCLKGKTKLSKPIPVVSDHIEIPKELISKQRDITLCMDTMMVNTLSFLTTVSCNLLCRSHLDRTGTGSSYGTRICTG